MLWNDALNSWLVHSALISMVILTLGSGAVLLCRQPTRRMRIIELTLTGCLVAPWLGMIPGYPQLTPDRWLAAGDCPNFRGHRCEALVDENGTVPFGVVPPSLAKQAIAPIAKRLPRQVIERVAQRNDTLPTPVRRVASTPSMPSAPIIKAVTTPAQSFDFTMWLVPLYVLGVISGGLWWVVGIAGLAWIVWTSRTAPPLCRELLCELAGRRSDRVRLIVSKGLKQPFAAAWGRPVIVLPENLCSEGQPLRWCLAHEWAHVERHDFRAWFMAGLVRVLFFYNPLVWWLRRHLRLCQDFVADARAARHASQPEDYAEFLTHRAAAGSLHPALIGVAVGFRKSELYRRIIMLVENRSLESRAPRLWNLSVTLAAVVLIAAVAALLNAPKAAAQGESAKPAATKQASASAEAAVPAPLAPEPAKGDLILDGPAAAAVYEFLEATRTGNHEKAAAMLTSKAREKTAAMSGSMMPPASDTARFTVGKVEYVGKDGAHVAATWTDIDEAGHPKTDSSFWILRRESQDWRISGVTAKIFVDKDAVVLNFEDPEDMRRQQQSVRDEMLHRNEPEEKLGIQAPEKILVRDSGARQPSLSTKTVSPNEAAATDKINKALESPAQFDFNNTPLNKVVDQLSAQHGIEIWLSAKALAEEGIASDTPITRKIKDISLRSALRLLLKDLNLTYAIKDGVLLITSPSDVPAEITVYPVRDLVLVSYPNGGAEADFDSLVNLIKTTVRPTTWDQLGGTGTIVPFENNLSIVVCQTQEVHGEIAQFLEKLRAVSREQAKEALPALFHPRPNVKSDAKGDKKAGGADDPFTQPPAAKSKPKSP